MTTDELNSYQKLEIAKLVKEAMLSGISKEDFKKFIEKKINNQSTKWEKYSSRTKGCIDLDFKVYLILL